MSNQVEYCEACGGRVTHEDGCVVMPLEAELDRLTNALRDIAALDYRYAGTNCCAYEAHKIAKLAISGVRDEDS